MDEATEQKQTYLRTEIIDKGYDPEVFTAYISNLKGEDGIDLNLWSMEELVNVVKSFQEQQSNNNTNINTNEEYKQFYDNSNIQEQIEERKSEEHVEEIKEEEKKEEEIKPDLQQVNVENNNLKESSFNILENDNKKEEINLKDTYTNIETPIEEPNKINQSNDLNGGAIEPKIDEIKEENNYKPPEPTGSIEDLLAAQNKDYYSNNNSNHLTIDLPEKK